METTSPSTGPQTTTPVAAPAAEHHSISTLQTSQPLSQPSTAPQDVPAQTRGIQMDTETPMDMSIALTNTLTESTLASDPTLTPQTTLNSDLLLSTLSPPQPMPDSYTPSSGYVSYMETLLHSHFPQDDGPRPLY